MNSKLGPNAHKWVDVIISYINDPSKFDLTNSLFGLPLFSNLEKEMYLQIAEQTWKNINPKSTNSLQNLDQVMPLWMVFLLPRRPSAIYLSVWIDKLRSESVSQYQEVMFTFQELIQNFIREELLLFKVVRPFRKKLGISLLNKDSLPVHPVEEYNKYLKQFTSPQKILSKISNFVEDKTLQAGIAYLLMIEKFSVILSRTTSDNQFMEVVDNFKRDIIKLENFDFKLKHKSQMDQEQTLIQSLDTQTTEMKVEGIDGKSKKIIEFEIIELKEFDGYVQISGYSKSENRNFRIMNCLEEDKLREEIWKERPSHIRRLVSEVLEDKYSNSQKLYKLKWGVDIKLKKPNWLS